MTYLHYIIILQLLWMLPARAEKLNAPSHSVVHVPKIPASPAEMNAVAKQKLLNAFQESQTDQVQAFRKQNRLSLSEFQKKQYEVFSTWCSAAKKTIYEKSNPKERRLSIKAYREARDQKVAEQKEALLSLKRSQDLEEAKLLNFQKESYKKFEEALQKDQAPAESLWLETAFPLKIVL